MRKIITILIILALMPLINAQLEESASEGTGIAKVSSGTVFTALDDSDCSVWDDKCSPSENAYYYSCYKSSDGTCLCYRKYCDSGYQCVDGSCKKQCTVGYTWTCSGDYKVKYYTNSGCDTNEVDKIYCGSGKSCKMVGTTATCVSECNAGTTYWECSTVSPTRINRFEIKTDCTIRQIGNYFCNEGYTCNDARCVEEGKYIAGYVCPEGKSCNSDKYYCSVISPNKRVKTYQKVDGATSTTYHNCPTGYTCKVGDCVKLESGCSSPSAKINEFYCKDNDVYKCASNNQWYKVKTFSCESGCKTSTPSPDYKSLCKVECSKSTHPDYCGTDGKLRYDYHLSSTSGDCKYNVKSCPSGQDCIGTGCKESSKCEKDGRNFETAQGDCWGNDYYICTIDGTFHIINNDPECVSCTSKCEEGKRECESNGFKICGDYDDDKCLEWGDINNCENGCDNGECILSECLDMPEPQCSKAEWIDYPECSWDNSFCDIPDCGDGIIQESESCENCPKDVICEPNEFCFDHTCIVRSETCDNNEDDDNDGLVDCEDEDCTDSQICSSCSSGETISKTCEDETEIITHHCINSEWQPTGDECETTPEIPAWIIPVAIGSVFLIGLVIILMSGKKKKGKKK